MRKRKFLNASSGTWYVKGRVEGLWGVRYIYIWGDAFNSTPLITPPRYAKTKNR
jgi:hypothetical protein